MFRPPFHDCCPILNVKSLAGYGQSRSLRSLSSTDSGNHYQKILWMNKSSGVHTTNHAGGGVSKQAGLKPGKIIVE